MYIYLQLDKCGGRYEIAQMSVFDICRVKGEGKGYWNCAIWMECCELLFERGKRESAATVLEYVGFELMGEAAERRIYHRDERGVRMYGLESGNRVDIYCAQREALAAVCQELREKWGNIWTRCTMRDEKENFLRVLKREVFDLPQGEEKVENKEKTD